MNAAITVLRLNRQHLIKKATISEYDRLFRDLQPGVNVYWNGFGDPPILKHRAAFDDMEYNRQLQRNRTLLKLRLSGGNLGWIIKEDIELFASLYCKPLEKPSILQRELLSLIEHEGPMNIQQMKESTGKLVKEITPALHRLQEAFLIYEDQYDGEWDREWYQFKEMFETVDLTKYSKKEALKIVLSRYAYRMVWFDCLMAKSYYKLPEREISTAISELIAEGVLISYQGGCILTSEEAVITSKESLQKSVFAIHKNDILYKSYEHILKNQYQRDGVETLYYLLIDGEFHGAAYGKFRYGPPDFDDLMVDLSEEEAVSRKEEIMEAVILLSGGKFPDKYRGKK